MRATVRGPVVYSSRGMQAHCLEVRIAGLRCGVAEWSHPQKISYEGSGGCRTREAKT